MRPVPDDAEDALCIVNPFSALQDTIIQHDTVSFPFDLVTRNPQMLALKEQIQTVSQNSSNILLLGESGTGKEVIARTIHASGPRRSRPFVTVNCAAIPETLLESELFGYEEGAFTGAKRGGRIGKFMLADTGTLFLDEIGDMAALSAGQGPAGAYRPADRPNRQQPPGRGGCTHHCGDQQES